MGILLMLVWRQRQAIEFQKQRSIIQALAAQKDSDNQVIKDVFEHLKEAFFPFEKNARTSEIKKMEEVMRSWISRGPLAVKSLEEAKPVRKKITAIKKPKNYPNKVPPAALTDVLQTKTKRRRDVS